MFGLFGCRDKKENAVRYKVDYDGCKDCYKNAKDEYAPGDTVEVYYDLIATDTDYSFWLDGERINTGYEDDKGFIIRFTMPEHDVKLECRHVNSMVYVPPTKPDGAGVKLIDCYRGSVALPDGGHYDEIVAESYGDGKVKLSVYHMENGSEDDVKTYIVPYRAVEECYEMIDMFDMRSWNSLSDTDALEGARLSCEFRDGYRYIEVTSDKMPENGKEAFSAVESALYKYTADEYLVTE